MSHLTPAPGAKQTSTKAIVGAVAAGAVAALGTFTVAYTGDQFVDPGEWAGIISSALVGSGVTGFAVWGTTNKPL